MRIAVTGPESSGKSKLTIDLSRALNIPFTSEYSRAFLNDLGRPYDQSDLTNICEGQIAKWQEFQASEDFISDTEMISLKIWSEVKYGFCEDFIMQAINNQKFDLYLLCLPDLPWEFDKMREAPSQKDRNLILNRFKREFEMYKIEYQVVSGIGNERFKNAMGIVKKTFNNLNI